MSGDLVMSLDLQLPEQVQAAAGLRGDVASKMDEKRHQLWHSSSEGCRLPSPASTTTDGTGSDSEFDSSASEWPNSPDTVTGSGTPCLPRDTSCESVPCLFRMRAISTGRMPERTALSRDLSSLSMPRRAWSVPAVTPAMEARSRTCGRREVPVEIARLMMPKRPDEYVECCRFARSFSEELFFAFTVPNGAILEARDMQIKALSEGLLGGRLGPSDAPSASSTEAPQKRKPVPFSTLEDGIGCEGKVLRRIAAGLLLDVGASRPGLLRNAMLHGLPRKLLKKGEVIAGLEIESVDKKKRRFTLRWRPLRDEEGLFGEVEHEDILDRIASWAQVDMNEEDDAKQPEEANGRMSAPGFADVGFIAHESQRRAVRAEAFGDSESISTPALPTWREAER
eukprot:TRINITY_DN12156_c0_g1_i1.p2 TRINITY_DN12156_c0_g1~~TRINITY_DN12156_c0_g1_i1.p2  ORF type:complete len:396 (-),score=85.75 TRINITY_DN12156_c0_g1_i1:60-1247(-)